LAQQLLSHLAVLGHADLAVHSDGLSKKLAGLVAVARGVALDEHTGVVMPRQGRIGTFIAGASSKCRSPSTERRIVEASRPT